MFVVEDRMTRAVVTASPVETLAAVACKMKAGKFRRLPVVNAGKLIGIISEFDLRRCEALPESTLIENTMTRDPLTVMPSDTLQYASELMQQHEVGALPVVHGGKVVGIITAKNLMMPEPRPTPEWDPRTRGQAELGSSPISSLARKRFR